MPKSTNYIAKVPDERGYIKYDNAEHSVWADLYAAQAGQVKKYCSDEYLNGLDRIELPADRIPSCPEISEKLKDMTGWRVEPVPALIGFKRFFSLLAEKAFPAASFIRSRDDFDYVEEPDIFHEIFGHVPLLSDQRFADFSESIGKAGVIAEKEDYSWLIRLYWFTIEFGLIQHNGGYKALGSGLASSPTELVHSVESPEPDRRPFNVIDILRTPYRIDIHQPVYFALESADTLFAAADRDLLADIAVARKLGLHDPTYPLEKISA